MAKAAMLFALLGMLDEEEEEDSLTSEECDEDNDEPADQPHPPHEEKYIVQ